MAIAAGCFLVPLVLVGAEGDAVDLAGEVSLPVAGVEHDLNGVIVGLIAIDQHHRPLTIRPLNRVGCHQHIAGGVDQVA